MTSFRKVKRIGGGIAAFAVMLVLSALVVAPLVASAVTSSEVKTDSSVLANSTFNHIDVKTAAAYTNGNSSTSSVSEIVGSQLKYTYGTTYQSTGFVSLSSSTSNGEWQHDTRQNIHSFGYGTTITISFRLAQGGDVYTSELTSESTYPENTVYPKDGANAYKLYNYINGTSYSNNDGLSEDIDISNWSVFLVSAIVCDGSTVRQGQLTNTNGLDLVLNVETLLDTVGGVSIAVNKTLEGADASTTTAQFNFTLVSATESNGTWSVGETIGRLQTTADWTTVSEDVINQVTASTTAPFADSDANEYYFILSENVSEGDDGIEYDSTVYGICVTVKTETSIQGSVSTTTRTVSSVEYYKLTANEDGTTYTVVDDQNPVTVNPENGVYIFSFTNSVIAEESSDETTDDGNGPTEEEPTTGDNDDEGDGTDTTDPDDDDGTDDGDDTETGDETDDGDDTTTTDDGDDAATTTDDGSSDTDDSTGTADDDNADADVDDAADDADADDADADDASTLPSTGDVASLVALGSAVAAGAAAVAGGVHLRRKRQ